MSLDPKTNRRTREAEEEAQNIPPALEPDFPFTQYAFDPFLFGVTVLTAPEEGADE